MKKIFLILLVSLLSVGTLVAHKKDKDKGMREFKDRGGKQFGIFNFGDNAKFCRKDMYLCISHELKDLDLTRKQERALREIRDEGRDGMFRLMSEPSREVLFKPFAKDGFDKELFIEEQLKRQQAKLEHIADLIEKAYDLLDTKQRSELIEELLDD